MHVNILMYTQASEYALFFYDVLYLYAMSVRAALDQGTDPRNGTKMFQIATQQSFLGEDINQGTCVP